MTSAGRLRQYRKLADQLVSERQGNGWDAHWRELSENLLPRRARFLNDPRNAANTGEKRHQAIIDNCALRALNALASGMQTSITSPARPWFNLTLRDAKMAKSGSVKRWLAEVKDVLRTVFARSNTYTSLHTIYHDLGGYGTSCGMVMPDLKTVLRVEVLPMGSYALATDALGRVDTMVRNYSLTIRQASVEFGEENLREQTREMLRDSAKAESRINIRHVIKPNDEYSDGNALAKHMRWSSCHFEESCTDDDEVFLRESGFDVFPVLAPRWAVTSDEDAYGYGPGMEALGDIKALQYQQKTKARATDKAVDPPLQGPPELNNRLVSTLPGQLTTVSSSGGTQGIRPIYQVNLDMNPLLEDIASIEQRIRDTFFASLFLSITESDRRQITAEEIRAREQEKLLQLGPVLERLTPELLNPLIDLAMEYAARAGLIPRPPAELKEGDELDVEHISILAEAQKLAGVASIERLSGFAANVVAVTKDQSLVDKFDWDIALEVYADAVGSPPKMLRSEDDMNAIRQQRSKQQQTVQSAQLMQSGAATAKDLAQTPLDQDTALTRLVAGGAL